MKRYMAVLALFAGSVSAAPFVISDTYVAASPNPTHCTYTLDGGARVPDVPVELTPTGPRCRFDIAGVTSGTHTMVAYAVVVDGFGRQESAPSVPFVFTRRDRPQAPSGLRITP